MSHDVDVLDAASKISLYLGVLALGVALGATLGLFQLQSSCIAAGVLPEPGTPVIPEALSANHCWTGAKTLQNAANAAGAAAAALLIVGGVADRYDRRVRVLFSEVSG